MTQFKPIRCLVIDDEMPAREILKKHIGNVAALEPAGEFSNAVEAMNFLQHNSVDLLFLDIQMPHLLGTSFIRTMKQAPKVIFTTAYRKFALEGFELNAVDYLLKPIGFERFLQAVNKVLNTMFVSNEKNSLSEPIMNYAPHFLYFRVDRKMVKVFLDDILFFESDRDYIKIFTTGKPILTKQPLSNLEELLPAEAFLRIHRSYIVAVNKIESFNADSVEINKQQLPIGRMYKHDVMKTLNASSADSQGDHKIR